MRTCVRACVRESTRFARAHTLRRLVQPLQHVVLRCSTSPSPRLTKPSRARRAPCHSAVHHFLTRHAAMQRGATWPFNAQVTNPNSHVMKRFRHMEEEYDEAEYARSRRLQNSAACCHTAQHCSVVRRGATHGDAARRVATLCT